MITQWKRRLIRALGITHESESERYERLVLSGVIVRPHSVPSTSVQRMLGPGKYVVFRVDFLDPLLVLSDGV